MRYFYLALVFVPMPALAFLGSEMVPLLELVAGQVRELELLSQNIGVTKENIQIVRDLNDGIEKTVAQIHAIESIIERSKGLDPTAIRSLSELNDYLNRSESLKRDTDDVMTTRTGIAENAVAQTAIQTDTTYKMGQEMIVTGSQLATESQNASPGRAAQITAASSSAQMMAQGVELQTLAHLAQVQAMLLDLQKSQIDREVQSRREQRKFYESRLVASRKKVQR